MPFNGSGSLKNGGEGTLSKELTQISATDDYQHVPNKGFSSTMHSLKDEGHNSVMVEQGSPVMKT